MEGRRPKLTLTAAASLLATVLATAASGADLARSASPEPAKSAPVNEACDAAALAANYERMAADEAAAAERYRTWASAEEMFSSGVYGKRYTELYYQGRASLMDAAAAKDRARAARVRGQAKSGPPDACTGDVSANG